MPLLIAFIKGFNLSSYTNDLWSIDEDVMTKNMNISWFKCAVCSLIHRITSKWLVFEKAN